MAFIRFVHQRQLVLSIRLPIEPIGGAMKRRMFMSILALVISPCTPAEPSHKGQHSVHENGMGRATISGRACSRVILVTASSFGEVLHPFHPWQTKVLVEG